MTRNYPSSLAHQSGLALMAVLLFLILIMVVGAIAVRQASVDLNVAASDQVGTLLINNSDSVLAHIEVAAASKGSGYAEIMSQQHGPLGYFTVGASEKVGTQVSLCYRPSRNNVFDIKNSSVRTLGSGFVNTSIACNPNETLDYTSVRNTAMTQIIVQGLKDETSDDFIAASRGTSEGGGMDGKISPKIQVNSASVLPAMSNKPADVIQNCLARPIGNASDYGIQDGNINDCLRQNNIPSNLVVEEGMLRDEEDGGYTGKEIESPCAGDTKCAAGLANPK